MSWREVVAALTAARFRRALREADLGKRVIVEDDGVLWLCTDDGYFRVTVNVQPLDGRRAPRSVRRAIAAAKRNGVTT